MRIAELARRAGVARSAIRWYEDAGVLPRAVRGDNNYRQYGETDLARLRIVASLRRLGLGPSEAGKVARLCVDQAGADFNLAPLVAEQRAAIERQRADLNRLEAELLDVEMTVAAARRVWREDSMERPIRVLFVCSHNSARSQIAEALLEHYGGDDFEVCSAGTEPGGVNPYTVRVLNELGVDWSGATSKAIDGFLGERFDYVITVCDRARQTCPVFPGSDNTLHWGLDDPAEIGGTDAEELAAFRQTRLEISARLRPFIEIALRAAGRPRGSAVMARVSGADST